MVTKFRGKEAGTRVCHNSSIRVVGFSVDGEGLLRSGGGYTSARQSKTGAFHRRARRGWGVATFTCTFQVVAIVTVLRMESRHSRAVTLRPEKAGVRF